MTKTPRKNGEVEDDEKKIKRRRLESYQVEGLEAEFNKNQFPSTQTKEELATAFDLKPATVNKWFINRRAKMRSETQKDVATTKENGKNGEKVKGRKGKSKDLEGPPKIIKITLFEGKNEKKSSEETVLQEGGEESSQVSSTNETTMQTNSENSSDKIKVKVEGTLEGKKRDYKKSESKKTETKKTPKKKKLLKPTKEEEQFWAEYIEQNLPNEEIPTNQKNPYLQIWDDPEEESEYSNEFIRSLPEWKQMVAHSMKNLENRRTSEKTMQKILQHIVKIRTRQKLPPFFAMLTGPDIPPYRMEELSLILGRNSQSHKIADFHLSNSKAISHAHARIYFDFEKKYFVLENLSKNGLYFKEHHKWVHYSGFCRIPLPNPSFFKIGDSTICFQLFFIRPERGSITDLIPNSIPCKVKKNKPTNQSFVSMIEQSLKEHHGQATFKDITDYIGKNYGGSIGEQKTWRSSINGILSSNSMFEAVLQSNGSKLAKRGSGKTWRLKDYAQTKDSPNGEPASQKTDPFVFVS